jgi:multicomponent Na+:H+ antiporter subunit D
MTGLEFLIVLVPFAGAVVSCFARGESQTGLGVGTAIATAGTVMLLARRIVEHGASTYPLGGWAATLGITLQVDGLSVLMLALTAVVAIFVSVYAASYFAGTSDAQPSAGLFWPLWLLLWGGLNALFVSADVFNPICCSSSRSCRRWRSPRLAVRRPGMCRRFGTSWPRRLRPCSTWWA